MRRLAVLIVCGLTAVACSRTVDIQKTLKVTDIHTGWYDAGLVEGGKNKLVPSISLKLQNAADGPVGGVQLNAIFHRVGENEAWGEHYVQAVDRSGLTPGASTEMIVLRSNLGYTGESSRLDMLKNSAFVDARVDVFGKQGRGNWVRLGAYQIDRQLLTQ